MTRYPSDRSRHAYYVQLGLPPHGTVDKVSVTRCLRDRSGHPLAGAKYKGIYFYRSSAGDEGLGIWFQQGGRTKCRRLGAVTLDEALLQHALARSAPAPDAHCAQIALRDAAASYLEVHLERAQRALSQGANDTRKIRARPGTHAKKRSAMVALGLISPANIRTASTYASPITALALEDLTDDTIRAVIDWMTSDRGLKPSTQVTYLGELRRLTEYCVRNGWLAKAANPWLDFPADDLPAATTSRQRVLSALEIAELRDAFSPGMHRVGFLLDIETGLRANERLGRRWRDIDEHTHMLRVATQLGRAGARAPLTDGPPKTEAGNRYVPLSDAMLAELATLRASARHAGPDDYIWCWRDGRPLSYDYVRQHVWNPVVEAVGLNRGLDRQNPADQAIWVTWHTLRHTYASIVLSQPDADIDAISRYLGHASRRITEMFYKHFWDEGRRAPKLRTRVGELFAFLHDPPSRVPTPADAHRAAPRLSPHRRPRRRGDSN